MVFFNDIVQGDKPQEDKTQEARVCAYGELSFIILIVLFMAGHPVSCSSPAPVCLLCVRYFVCIVWFGEGRCFFFSFYCFLASVLYTGESTLYRPINVPLVSISPYEFI